MNHRLILPVTLLLTAGAATAQWSQAAPSTVPAGRIEPGMAFDSGNGVTVLFGGADVAGFPPQTFADTWTWDGLDWTQQSPAASPAGRYFGGMTYDSLRGRVVLYGGLSPTFFGANYLDDTWEWDGSNWTQISPPNTPGSLVGNRGIGECAMAFDQIGNRTVVFGGELFQGIVPMPNDTLEYDGFDWTLVPTSTTTAPPRRTQAAMCSAPTLGGVLLFGGTNFNNPPGPNGEIVWNDLWVYASTTDTWTQLQPAGQLPPPRAGASLLFDTHTGLYVMHGGYTDNAGMIQPLADTWTFDGTTWTDVTAGVGSPTSPRIRFASADGPSGCHVTFGGAPAVFGAPYAETWVYGSCAAAAAYGAGCAGSNGVPSLAPANRPVLGTTYQLDAGNLAAGAAFAFVVTGFSDATSSAGPLPLNLGLLGLDPSCFLLTSTDANALVPAAAGAASYALSIPAAGSFAGIDLFHQAGSIDAAATGGFAVSNGVHSLLGSF